MIKAKLLEPKFSLLFRVGDYLNCIEIGSRYALKGFEVICMEISKLGFTRSKMKEMSRESKSKFLERLGNYGEAKRSDSHADRGHTLAGHNNNNKNRI